MAALFSILAGIALLVVFVLGLRWSSRQLLEKPAFTVELAEPPIQIRRYEARWAAETEQPGNRTEAVRKGFGPLSRYISGRRRGGDRMAMTVPVSQTPAGSDRWKVHFVLPAAIPYEELPAPREDVKIVQLPERSMAVIRFSGKIADSKFENKEAELREWLASKELEPLGDPVFAYYDPPLMPSVLRRNEIMLEVRSDRS